MNNIEWTQEEVNNTIQRWEAFKARNGNCFDNEYRALAENMNTLVEAWKNFKLGKATEEQQMICMHIHKYILNKCIKNKGEPYKDDLAALKGKNASSYGSQYIRNIILDGLITLGVPHKEAIKKVSEMFNRSEDTVNREFNKFTAQPAEYRAKDYLNFGKIYINPFD